MPSIIDKFLVSPIDYTSRLQERYLICKLFFNLFISRFTKTLKTMKTKELREKPGRKPIQDKKEPVTIYVRKSEIKRHGGRKKMRTMLNNYLWSIEGVAVL